MVYQGVEDLKLRGCHTFHEGLHTWYTNRTQ